jgi:NADH-ubiquinone oxidoreductase chain 2
MIIYSLIYLLLSNAFNVRKDKSILYSRLVIIIILFTSILLLKDLYFNNLNKGIALFGGLYHTTTLTHVFHFFILILSLIIMCLTGFYPRKVWNKDYSSLINIFLYKYIYSTKKILNKTSKQFRILEYPLIILFIIIGALLLISTNDLISIFLSIELQSYGLYIISTLYRNSEISTSGGLTYFLLGGLSSCFILLGSSILYVNSGTTYLEGFYVITSISDLLSNNIDILYWYKPYYIYISLLIISVGLLFKISAAPFHFWSPDVYDAIPTLITTFVAIISKISIFVLLLQLVHFTSKSVFIYNYTWTITLLISSLLSLIIGTVGGLTQFRIKRLYAYSTISHVGFLLLALSINSIESIQAFIFYIIQYSLSNLNAFIILLSIGYTLYNLIDNDNRYKYLQEKNNSPIQYISQIKGYFYINPILALSFSITFFSFVGVPPLIGFFGKQMIISAALDNGYVFLAIIAILTSVISAVYYLAVIKQIFFYKPDYKNLNYKQLNLFNYVLKENKLIKKNLINNIVLSSSLTNIISILTLLILLFILIPQEYWDMTNILSLIIFNN